MAIAYFPGTCHPSSRNRQGWIVDTGYRSRLGLMEDWYRDFLRSEDSEAILVRDYAPHRSYLEGLSGSVVDIGGGAGLPARFLRPEVTYVVVEPSRIWRSPDWIALAKRFRLSGAEPTFVEAAGEELPFADSEFDSALSLWTLNHVRDPAACIREMARVLKPGGSALVVLEDVEPGWGDLLCDTFRRVGALFSGRRGTAGIHMRLPAAYFAKIRDEWPLQEDHLRIRDEDLAVWLKGIFRVRRRSWIGGCLTYDLVRSSG